MLQPKDAFVRTYALEMLASVNTEPFINKEKLFSDAMAYYRWQLAEKRADEALDIYMQEFRAHHEPLVKLLSLEVWTACFVTWFVEQGFHKLPPLRGFDPTNELMKRLRFSSPSFRLPTGEPTETYLIQWVRWRVDHALAASTQPDRRQVARWAREMVGNVPEYCRIDRCLLLEQATRFFHWASVSLLTWTQFVNYITSFLYNDVEQVSDLPDEACWDACFVHWFCLRMLDRADGPERPIPPAN